MKRIAVTHITFLRVVMFLAIFGAQLSTAYSQVAIGDTLKEPHSSAELEVFSGSKGFLPPRLTTAQRDGIESPAEGLLVFDTDLNRLMYFNDSTWRDISFWSTSDTTDGIFYNDGNVGVGTTEPEELLHIAGNALVEDTVTVGTLKIDSGACDGCVLKSNSAGIASWVDPDSLSAVSHTLWVSAGAMIPQATNGAKAFTEQSSTTLTMADYLVFDTTDYAQFSFSTTKKVISTVNIQVYWNISSGATAGDSIKWGIAAKAVSNDDAIDGSWGTEAVVTDAVTAVGDLHITSAASVTVGSSPALGDAIWFRIRRKSGGTYVPENAKLASVLITY